MPNRIQRKRTKGWKMPHGAVYVGRPTKWGNPFKVGGYFMIGDPEPEKAGIFRMAWCEATLGYETPDFTLITSPEMAVRWYRALRKKYPLDVSDLKGKDLVCWCPLDQPCHADVLLELANEE